MRFLFAVLFLTTSVTVYSQEDTQVTVLQKVEYDSLRANYIKTFPDHFFLWPVIKQRRLDFEMNQLRGGNKSLTYKTNNPFSMGLGVYLFELGIELAFSVPLDEQSKKIYGESDARDLQLNIIGKKWGIEVYSQKYSGFYIEDPDENIPAGTPYPQRPDIVTRNLGTTINYTFNNRKFSFRSAYNFADRQLRSAGSFLLFGSLSGFKVEADSAIIGPRYADEYGIESGVDKIRSTTLAVAPGYTYSLIYKGFFLNGTLALGPAHNWLYYHTEDGVSKNDIKFSGYIVARIGLGYNGDHFFGGISFLNQSRTTKFDNVEVVSSSGAFKILIGYRFREFGVLKKRVWDIPKALFP
ncbi:MAG TPA: DUF4421 family protein [Ohtaekwangia sp.]